MLQVIVFAFRVVIGSAALMTPFLLYVLRLGASGWKASWSLRSHPRSLLGLA